MKKVWEGFFIGIFEDVVMVRFVEVFLVLYVLFFVGFVFVSFLENLNWLVGKIFVVDRL